VNFAKDRVKYEEFNAQDKINLMELFVSNKVTLFYIYQSLFPQKIKKQVTVDEMEAKEGDKIISDNNKYFITENLHELNEEDM